MEEIEKNIDKVEESEIEEDKEVEDLVENIDSLLSLEISHNRIIFLDKRIKNKEKTHKNWKYNYWKDYRTWLEVEILDRDFWKSAELMRLVLETKKKNKALLIIWVIFSFIFVFIFLIIIWNFLTKKEDEIIINKQINPIITQPQIQKPIEINNNVLKDEKNIEKNIDKVEKDVMIENENKNKTNWNENIQLMSLDYQSKQLTLELNLTIKKNELLVIEIEEKNKLIENKQIEINNLYLIISDNQAKLNNLTSNDFYLYLGKKVEQECEKNQNNYCKELYYWFLKK